MLRRPRRAMSQINVVPYIDVMLVLLVIFMVTAPMINPGQIDLPSVGKGLTTPDQPAQLSLRGDGTLGWMNPLEASSDQALSRTQLLPLLQALHDHHPEQPVVIAADRNVRYEEVLQLMDLLKQAQIKRVGLLARSRN